MKLNRPATGLALASVALLPGLVACGPAPLSCTASISNATPKDYSRVFVYVHSWANTGFNTTARYLTTSTIKLGVTNTVGKAAPTTTSRELLPVIASTLSSELPRTRSRRPATPRSRPICSGTFAGPSRQQFA